MRVHDADGAVAALAASQHGAFTRDQAAVVGMTAKMIRARRSAGVLEESRPGVLVLASVPPSWRQQLSVGVLATQGRAVVGGEAAAGLHRLDGFPEGPLELCWTGASNHPLTGITLHRAQALDRIDRFVIDGLPVTGLARTLVDVGSVAPERLERALDDVRRRSAVATPRRHRAPSAGARQLVRGARRAVPDVAGAAAARPPARGARCPRTAGRSPRPRVPVDLPRRRGPQPAPPLREPRSVRRGPGPGAGVRGLGGARRGVAGHAAGAELLGIVERTAKRRAERKVPA